jgi:hypothetical protein
LYQQAAWYEEKEKGFKTLKDRAICSACEVDEIDSDFTKKRRITWAALIKSVYKVNPLECLNCGGGIKIISLAKYASRL